MVPPPRLRGVQYIHRGGRHRSISNGGTEYTYVLTHFLIIDIIILSSLGGAFTAEQIYIAPVLRRYCRVPYSIRWYNNPPPRAARVVGARPVSRRAPCDWEGGGGGLKSWRAVWGKEGIPKNSVFGLSRFREGSRDPVHPP